MTLTSRLRFYFQQDGAPPHFSIVECQFTVHDVVHKRLRLRAYKLQLRQHIKPADRDCWKTFYEEMLQKIDSDETFLDSVYFSDEATFHVNGIVNRHNCRNYRTSEGHAKG
jgi:hypothetical protein